MSALESGASRPGEPEHGRAPVTGGRPRRSLFWWIAGALLLTALLGTLAQAFLAVSVLRPLEARDQRARAELYVSRFDVELPAMPTPRTPEGVAAAMARVRVETGIRFVTLLYRDGTGLVVSDPPERAAAVVEALGGSSDRPRPAPPPPSDGRGPRRYEVLARRTLSAPGAPAAEIAVLRTLRPRNVGLGDIGTRALMLSLPIALLVSLAAGVLLVRLLVRRLHALEALAARVAEGDLSVRVQDRSGDEIGRLAEALNRMTERLAEARDRLGAQDRQRRQLFADITHELATPLTSIRGFTETLLDPTVNVSAEERTEYLGHTLAEARRLDRLVRDLFDLARLEAGVSPLEIESLDWVALCRNTLERFTPRFREAGLALEWTPSEAEAWVAADGHRLEEILENLLANELRYVPTGGRVSLAVRRAEGGRFRLTIADDGPGLPADELPHLFERFYRSASARGMSSRDGVGGSGLGLAIVREIVHRHGGAVRARANAPRGLVIEVELPERQAASRAATAEARGTA